MVSIGRVSLAYRTGIPNGKAIEKYHQSLGKDGKDGRKYSFEDLCRVPDFSDGWLRLGLLPFWSLPPMWRLSREGNLFVIKIRI
jgi:hypothetical protein